MTQNHVENQTLKLIALLHWSVEQYNEFQYKTAIEWLDWYFNGASPFQDTLERSGEFWKDWVKAWDRRNKWILMRIDEHAEDEYPDDNPKEMVENNDWRLKWETVRLFYQQHKVSSISECPSRLTLEQLGACMVQDMIDNHSKDEVQV